MVHRQIPEKIPYFWHFLLKKSFTNRLHLDKFPSQSFTRRVRDDGYQERTHFL